MFDFDEIVKNEEMKDVILFLLGYKEKGMSYPSIDRFFNIHKAQNKYESYNILLINVTKQLEDEGKIISNGKYGYIAGPNWTAPDFMVNNKYIIK